MIKRSLTFNKCFEPKLKRLFIWILQLNSIVFELFIHLFNKYLLTSCYETSNAVNHLLKILCRFIPHWYGYLLVPTEPMLKGL